MGEYRIALRNAGKINPNNIEDYIKNNGYEALKKALACTPISIIDEIEKSGKLRGRGGAGFSTGFKWRSAFETEANQKYIICNADEGEPGTYKDRIILESDPHTVLEGIAIAAHAIGATQAFIYCRGEYPHLIESLNHAISSAKQKEQLPNVDIQVIKGAGAYVCGEETALIESIEGHRGEPRLKPPYPTISGLWGKPTVVNNVETFAVVPCIIEKGSEWFSKIGSSQYPGTKVLCLSGDVNNKIAIEVTTDTTLHDVIYGFGGGIVHNKKLKAVQVGGTSCAFLTKDQLNTPIDFDSMSARGGSLGSGAVLVISEDKNMADVALSISRFFKHESCGKCTPCREGTYRVNELIENVVKGRSNKHDLGKIEKLHQFMSKNCFCPLGQSATLPATSAITQFREDFNKYLSEGSESCGKGTD